MEIQQLGRQIEEVSAHYASKHAVNRSDDWLVLKLNEEVGELTQAYLARGTRGGRPASWKQTSGPNWPTSWRKCFSSRIGSEST